MNDEFDSFNENDNNAENVYEQQQQEKNNQKKQQEQKDLDKSTAAVDAAVKTIVTVKTGKQGAKVYDAIKQTNIGKTVIQTAGTVVNEAQKVNPLLKQSVNTASKLNKIVNNGNEVEGKDITSDEEKELQSNQQNNQLQNKATDEPNDINEKNNNKQNPKESEEKAKKENIFTKVIKFIIKIPKFILIIIGINLFFLFFSIMFVIFFANGLLQNNLELTNWNYGSSSSSENINSDSNYSNDNSSSINTSNLNSLIGEDGINNLTSKINNAGTNCTGMGVASKVVSLIDGLNSYGYKVPYSNNAGDETQLVNSNWGVGENGNTVGFNDITFMNWALRASNIENKVTSINDYKDNALPINLENAKPGDVIIYQNNIYMILQNIGSSVIIAYVANDGLTYKSYSYNDLKDYDIYNMNLYYVDNCTN